MADKPVLTTTAGNPRMRHSLAVTGPGRGLALAFAVLMLFAGGIGATGASAAPVVVTAADAGKTVALDVGQSLIVKLDAQTASTGFAWEPDAASTPLLAFSGSTQSKANTPPGMVGGAATQSLTFVARAAGEGELKLVYRRPWEKNTPPARSFSVTVKIAAP